MPLRVVNFEVLLRSAGTGRSPTTENIAQFRPDPEALDRCRRWLCDRGVRVHATDFGLACSAPKVVFQSLFGTKLVRADPEPNRPAWRAVSSIQAPPEIASLVEEITIQQAPELF